MLRKNVSIYRFRFFLIILLWCGYFNLIYAQSLNLKFKHITVTQGLSNSTIEAIYQDSRGFMWFGTRDGLNKYDGNKITVFKNILNDSTSLSDNYIRSICEDRDHHLWIGTLNGLNKYNPYQNNFVRYKHNPLNHNSVSGNEITCIYQDKKGIIWIGTNGGGLDSFDSEHNLFKSIRHQKDNASSPPSNEVSCIYEDHKKQLWIGTDKGLCCYNRLSGKFTDKFELERNPNYQIKYAILKIQDDDRGNLWLGTANNGLLAVDFDKQTIKHFSHDDRNPFSLSTNQIRSLLADSKGNIWAGGINGSLDLYKLATDNFIHAKNDPVNPLSLSQKTLSAIFVDNQNNLWIGTHRGGINFYAPLADKFKLIQQGESNNGLSYNDVKSFYQDHQNKVWIGTDGGGLNLYDRTNNTFEHFKYNAYDNKSISSDAILSINEDHINNFWIGTWGGGLNLMDQKSKTFKRYVNNPSDRNSISSNYVQSTLEDSEENFWVATYYGGLNLMDRKTQKFTRVISDASRHTSLFGNNIVSINEDQDKNLWIGTDDGGLNQYNLINRHFKHYFLNGDKAPDIRVIFTDSHGRVWVGQAGLFLFDKPTQKFNLYNRGNLSNEFIKGILEDENGDLWVSTSNGLTRFNPAKPEFKQYNIADGLQGLEFEAGAFMKTRDGEMFFGGLNGFNQFYPRDIKLNRFEALVYITTFQIFNEIMLPGQKDSPLHTDISLTKQLTLTYQQSTLSFEFAKLDYTAPENNRYAYKLANFDHTWHYSNTENRANYTNLDPGNYIFYVKASNNDGIWSNKTAAIQINISPPFWATWWFRLTTGLIVITGCYCLLRFKKNFDLQKIEANKRDEMHKMQLQFFTNISHEFRTPLSLILGPVDKIIEQDKRSAFIPYYNTIHRNAHRLLLLINELMDFRKAETGALKLKVMPGNINLFITEVTEDFRNLALQKQIKLNVLINQDMGEAWFDRQILEKIILNLIDNAFKYTNVGGEISIEVYGNAELFVSQHEHSIIINNSFKGNKQVFIRVSDNGLGISPNSINHLFERYYRTSDTHMGSGIGLAFVKSLTLLHKGNIKVYSEKNAGTDIVINLPIGKDDYFSDEKWITNPVDNPVQLESIGTPFYQSEDELKDEQYIHPEESKRSNLVYKILIVDDNDEIRNFLRHSLDDFYKIIEAEDGLSGFAKATAELPDLIISDLMMPGMDGIDLCRSLKQGTRTGQIPFIILSAKDAIDSQIASADSGADLYFPKPISINLLLLSIRNIFEHRKVLKEQYLKTYFHDAHELTDAAKDKEFMDDFVSLIESQLSNYELDVDYLCREMGMSKTKLYHRVKNTSGQSIGEFVRTFRLKKAAYIITHEDVLLTDAMYRVGIQTQSYFTKAFKKEFGKTPSQFLQDIKGAN